MLEIDDILKNKPMDEWDKEDMDKMDDAKKQGNMVKLDEKDSMMTPGQNAKPIIHTVQKGESLKDIGEKYGISYGEMTTHMMNTEGSTNIHEGQEIKIPRHFMDLSKAI